MLYYDAVKLFYFLAYNFNEFMIHLGRWDAAGNVLCNMPINTIVGQIITVYIYIEYRSDVL